MKCFGYFEWNGIELITLIGTDGAIYMFHYYLCSLRDIFVCTCMYVGCYYYFCYLERRCIGVRLRLLFKIFLFLKIIFDIRASECSENIKKILI
jgi:hypothetical protein